MTEQDTIELARGYFLTEDNIYGCAETTFMVLKQAFQLPEPEDASPAMALNGGVAWSGGMCGAISGAALAVGMLAELRINDHKEAKRVARGVISCLMDDFSSEFGHVNCSQLIKLDIQDPEQHAFFIESGIWRDICMNQIEYAVSRLTSLYEVSVWEEILRELSPGNSSS